MSDIKFPKEPTPPSGSLADAKQLWYGLEKIGKTTLAAQFPDPLFLMTEPGASYISVRQVMLSDWGSFLRAISALRQKETTWRTLVIDTVDNLYIYCRKAVCQKLGISHPADAEYGKGWDELRREFFAAIHAVSRLPGGLIFISHAKLIEIRRRGGASFSRTVTTMGKAEEVIKPIVDIYAFYEFSETGRRVLHVSGDDLVSAGHRCVGHFRDEEGKAMRVIPMGKSAKEAYQNFVAAFQNKLVRKQGK